MLDIVVYLSLFLFCFCPCVWLDYWEKFGICLFYMANIWNLYHISKAYCPENAASRDLNINDAVKIRNVVRIFHNLRYEITR